MNREPSAPRSPWLGPAVVAIALLLVAGGLIVLLRNDEDTPPDRSGPATTAAPATTAVPATSAPATSAPATSVPAGTDTTAAVWPFAGSATRYSDPVAAARGFARDYVGFDSPVVGVFQQGDTRSGEVEVRPRADGPVTTVFVRQLGPDDRWWVLGAATANIDLREPAALATISSPVRLQGVSTAFEATVQAEVRQDGGTGPLGEGFVMGGANGELGPFDGTLAFTTPSSELGAVVLYTESAENGEVWEASVVRVRFQRA